MLYNKVSYLLKLKDKVYFAYYYNNIIQFIITYGAIPNKHMKQCTCSFSYLTVIDPSEFGFHKQVEEKWRDASPF